MEVLKEMNTLKGCKIRFKALEREFEGTIKSVCFELKRIVFSHTFVLPERTYMGTLRFPCHEIQSFSCLEGKSVNDGCYNTRRNCSEIFDVADLHELDNDGENEVSVSHEDMFEEEEYVLKLPQDLSSKLASDSVILDVINDEFHTAVQNISKEKIIGVSFEGPRINRSGILSWICISIPSCTFLFDISALRAEAFDNGLRSIFQNKEVEKVIHDCRQPADCLLHQFETCLVNVFDTQVADFFIQMQRRKSDKVVPRVSSLDTSLFQHLEISSEYLHPPKHYATYADKIISYNLRPLSEEFRNFAIKNVIYLRLLKEKLAHLLMAPFHHNVEIYLKVLANATKEELSLGLSSPNTLPPAVCMQVENSKMVCFKDFIDVHHPVSSGSHKLKNPVKDLIHSMKNKIKIYEENNKSDIKCAMKGSDICLKSNSKDQTEIPAKSLMSIDETYFSLVNSMPMNVCANKRIGVDSEVESQEINDRELEVNETSDDIWGKLCYSDCPNRKNNRLNFIPG